MADPRRDPVRHALRYPFRTPGRACLVTREGARPLVPDDAATAGRRPLLAAGSNASPARLREKLGDALGRSGILLVPAEARGLAVVHSAHLAAYGAVPATVLPCPGAVSRVFVLWLTEAQVARLDGTEALGVNYRRERLTWPDLHPEVGPRPAACDAYVSLHGPLQVDGAPVALAAVPREGVPWPSMDQRGVQGLAMARAGFAGTVADFVRTNVSEPAARARHTAALKKSVRRGGTGRRRWCSRAGTPRRPRGRSRRCRRSPPGAPPRRCP
jgi:hypothetical protein